MKSNVCKLNTALHRPGLLVAALISLAFSSPAGSTPAKPSGEYDKLIAAVGEVLIVEFYGMSEMGYRWKLNRSKSRGLDLISVRQSKTAKRVPTGSSRKADTRTFEFQVEMIKTGEGVIVFDYIEPDQKKSFISRTFKIEIGESATIVDINRSKPTNFTDIPIPTRKSNATAQRNESTVTYTGSIDSTAKRSSSRKARKRRPVKRRRTTPAYAIRGLYYPGN